MGGFSNESSNLIFIFLKLQMWRQLANVCTSLGLVPPKLSKDPVAATHTCTTHMDVNSVLWYYSSITFANVV